MKRLLYLTYIGLLLPFAFACQEENIEPNGQIIETLSDTLEFRTASCKPYTFFHKEYGNVNLGNVRSDYIMVGFAEDFSTSARQQLLSKYPHFDAIEDESYFYYTLISKVSLKAGTACFEVEKMLNSLEKHPAVLFAKPTFDFPNPPLLWRGLTNELLIYFEGETSPAQIENICKKLNLKILNQFDFGGFYEYTVSADKNSKRDILEVCTLFNKQPYVWEAVPNYYLQQDFSPPGDLELFSTESESPTLEQIK